MSDRPDIGDAEEDRAELPEGDTADLPDIEEPEDITADDRAEARYWRWRRLKSLERSQSTFGLSPLRRALPELTHTATRKRGFINSRLLLDWDKIMPEGVRGMARPLEVRRNLKTEDATLVLLVSSATALIISHYEPQLLERINSYFGFRAVTKLQMKQGILPVEKPRPLRPAPDTPPPPDVAARLAPVEDERLRTALARLYVTRQAEGKG